MNSLLSRISLFFIALSIPLSAIAAPPPADLIRTPDDEYVSRGDFIRASVKMLGFSITEDSNAKLPFKRVPHALKPYLDIAQEYGALSQFSNELLHAQSIKRGEALVILMKLMKLASKHDISAYRDISKGTDEGSAVAVALERGWLKSLSDDLYGVRRSLTGRDARLILGRLSREKAPEQEPRKITVRIKTPERVEIPQREMLRTIWQVLNNHFLYQEKLDSDEAAYRAAEAIVSSVSDPYTTFLRPKTAKEFQRQIKGEVSGIGAQVEYINEILTIIAPLPGSPALSARLQAGDQILKVDGESIMGVGFLDAVEKVRGPKGSTVLLRIKRGELIMDVEVIRDTIKVPEIDISFQGDIAVVKLIQFGRVTENDLRDMLKTVQSQNPKGIILDLRNNPGGLLHAASIVLSNFLPQGSTVAKIKTRTDELEELTRHDPTINKDVSVVVLVNKGSASASEIVAGTLQDAGRATVVGETTFGKGTVQQVLDFTTGSSIKLTIAEWYTPEGRQIDGKGIKPDIKVATDDERDEQMLRALKILR
jgi:carboxyl-terminal processing protease